MHVSGRVTSLVGKRDETIAYQLHQQIMAGAELSGVVTNRHELQAARKKEHYSNLDAAKKRAYKESRKCVPTSVI